MSESCSPSSELLGQARPRSLVSPAPAQSSRPLGTVLLQPAAPTSAPSFCLALVHALGRAAPSWLVSGAVHAVILVTLGLMAIAVEQGSSTQGLLGSFAEGEAELELSSPTVIELAAAPDETDETRSTDQRGRRTAQQTSAAMSLASAGAAPQIEVSPIETGVAAKGAVADQIATAIGRGETLERVVTGPPPGGGSGPVVGKGKASFFGVDAKGYKFVYIVDASGSMFGRRFAKAHAELVNSLSALDEHQSFYVIFFNFTDYPQYFPLPEDNLAPMSPKNLQRVCDWMAQNVIPQGETVPNSAISRALALAPDAIFLLSDGEFHDSAAEVVMRENYRRVPIHAIAFESELGAFSLGQIARLTGGTYRFVP
ncbi:MAG: hypothetical protein JNG90_19605 [Planctomycetaceae bacterium]|nr:hypothetical protein [Planctomycetaceae bacterium]